MRNHGSPHVSRQPCNKSRERHRTSRQRRHPSLARCPLNEPLVAYAIQILRAGPECVVGFSSSSYWHCHTPSAPTLNGDGTTILDLRGYSVMPGIVGMHDHLIYMARPNLAADNSFDGPVLFQQMTFSGSRLYLANGVTTIRTTGSPEPYTELKLKRAIDAGVLPGPHLVSLVRTSMGRTIQTSRCPSSRVRWMRARQRPSGRTAASHRSRRTRTSRVRRRGRAPQRGTRSGWSQRLASRLWGISARSSCWSKPDSRRSKPFASRR
jgi:hypothetical protein